MMKYIAVILILFAVFVCSACDNTLFEGKQDLPESRWIRNQPSVFTFEITSPEIPCQISCYVRYAANYPYYNLYVTAELSDEAGNILANKRHEFNLFDPQTGEPEGDGLGSLFEKETVLFDNYKFPVKGTYRLRLQQYMRPDTLTAVAAVGIIIRPVE